MTTPRPPFQFTLDLPMPGRGEALRPAAREVEVATAMSESGPSQDWGCSGRDRRLRELIVSRMEFLSEAGAERSIVDGAANLEQKIGAAPGPAHRLRFVHPAVHQEIGRPLGDRSANPQPGPMPFGIVDHPVALTGEIAIQRVQGGPQLCRRLTWR